MGYYILYGFLWVGGLLPLRILYFFSDIYFYLIYYLLKYRRRVVRANLQHAFPEKDLSEIIKIEKRYYRHLCDFFVEMYKMWHMSDEQIRRRCKFTNPEVIRRYFDQGKSVIGVLGHYGNWEWMSSYSLWMPREFDFFTLYKPLHNAVADKMMIRLRSRFGAKPVPKNDILRRIVENKRNGRLFLAGFIGDQTPNRANLNFLDGIFKSGYAYISRNREDCPEIRFAGNIPEDAEGEERVIMRWILSMYVVIPDNWNPGN